MKLFYSLTLLSIHTQKSQEVSSVKITSLEYCVLNYCRYSIKARATHFPVIPRHFS